MKLRKILACLLMLALLCADMAAVAEGLLSVKLPSGLVRIGEEAFSDTASFQKVLVQEGTKRIESRAFAGSAARQIHLPASVEFIADDAFEGCENLTLYVPRGSYAHKWAVFSDLEYVVLGDQEPAEAYRLADLKFRRTDKIAAVSVTTGDEACVLRVNLLDEQDEKLLYTYAAEAEAYLQGVLMEVHAANVPDYFVLEAVLEDKEGNALCKPLREIAYTRAYAEFLAAKPTDYPADRVLDFGSGGYAVLAENVIVVSGNASGGGDSYTLPSSAFGGKLPSAGDVLLLTVNGNPTPVKVGSVKTGKGDTVRIEVDSEIYLCDAFDSVKIGVYAEGGENGNGAGMGVNVPLDEEYNSKNGALNVTAKGGVKVMVSAQYDKKILRRDYLRFEAEASVNIDVVTTLKGEYETEQDEIKLDLYDGKVLIPGLNLPADLTVFLPLNAGVEGEGNFTIHYEKLAGFSWDTDNGFVEKEAEDNNYLDHELKVEFHADAGPKVELDFGFFDFFGAKVDAQIGVDATGTLTGKAHAGYVPPTDADEIHACSLCLGVDVDLFAKANANLYYKVTKEESKDLLEGEIFNLDLFDLLDLYASIINDVHSPYGGEYSEGLGKCKNIKYRANISAKDYKGKALKSVPYTGTGVYGEEFFGTAPDTQYLYNGYNHFTATFPSGVGKCEEWVNACPTDVVLKEPTVKITVKTVDNDTNLIIPGASVTLTLPDGTTKSGVTGADGTCLFENLPAGEYDFKATAANYQDRTLLNMKYTGGTNNLVTLGLLPKLDLPFITATTTKSGRVQAKTLDGTVPSHVPEIYLDTVIPSGYYDVSVKVSHSGCSETLDLYYDHAVYSIQFYGADMGNGEYTFILSATSAGRMGGEDHTIFRVRDGKFEIIGEFDMESHSMDIPVYLDASFTAANKLTGKIQPMGIKFTATFNQSDSGRVGRKPSRRRLGYLDFVENCDGYYDMVFKTDDFYEYIQTVFFGGTTTRYVLKDDKLVVASQSLTVSSGSVSYS